MRARVLYNKRVASVVHKGSVESDCHSMGLGVVCSLDPPRGQRMGVERSRGCGPAAVVFRDCLDPVARHAFVGSKRLSQMVFARYRCEHHQSDDHRGLKFVLQPYFSLFTQNTILLNNTYYSLKYNTLLFNSTY